MTHQPQIPMTVDAFLAWSEGRPGRYELYNGRVFAMAPQRAGHAQVKYGVQKELERAINQSSTACHMLPDGMTIRVNETTAHEPDALVYCGPKVARDLVEIENAVIVVEVLSPSTRRIDASTKLVGYMSRPTIQHYLIVDPEGSTVIHHQKQADGLVLTRIISSASIELQPPGITVDVAAFFV